MKQGQDCNVVMLPQNKLGYSSEDLIKHPKKGLRISDSSKEGFTEWQAQHLYFTDNSEIKKGDTMYHITNGKISTCTGSDNVTLLNACSVRTMREFWKKTIASTDPSLNLPGIQESFIKQYITAQGKIDKVRLETEIIEKKQGFGSYYIPTNGNDGQIPILKLTDNNEVIVLDEREIVSQKIMETTKDFSSKEITKDSELEDAAHFHACKNPQGILYLLITDSFKAGTNWQKEQSAIEFAQWAHFHSWEWIKSLDQWFRGSEYYSSKELYELWLQNR